MPFCANCGSAVEGRFCAKCGTPMDAGVPPVERPPAGPGPGPGTAPGAAGLTENAASALCYVLGFITGIIFLIVTPYSSNRNIRFHAFQSIFLSVGWFAVVMVVNVIASILRFYSLYSLTSLVGLAFFVLWIYLIVSSYQGKKVVLPIIGPLAQQQA